jgi:hypothetical protein
MALFSKTNIMIIFSAKLPFVRVKTRRFFRQIFLQKSFKNHNIGPRRLTEKCAQFCQKKSPKMEPCSIITFVQKTSGQN